jgi:hypothetical protein
VRLGKSASCQTLQSEIDWGPDNRELTAATATEAPPATGEASL